MIPVRFEECNCVFGPPPDLDEKQVRSIPAHLHEINGGSCDGLKQVVVAYRLTREEIEALAQKEIIYLSMIGGLAPHYLSFSFEQATHPA